jgi:hypothetical protein
VSEELRDGSHEYEADHDDHGQDEKQERPHDSFVGSDSSGRREVCRNARPDTGLAAGRGIEPNAEHHEL